MNRKWALVAFGVSVLVLAGCSRQQPSEPPGVIKADSVIGKNFCRSGWSVSSGKKPDSVYTGCTE